MAHSILVGHGNIMVRQAAELMIDFEDLAWAYRLNGPFQSGDSHVILSLPPFAAFDADARQDDRHSNLSGSKA